MASSRRSTPRSCSPRERWACWRSAGSGPSARRPPSPPRRPASSSGAHRPRAHRVRDRRLLRAARAPQRLDQRAHRRAAAAHEQRRRRDHARLRRRLPDRPRHVPARALRLSRLLGAARRGRPPGGADAAHRRVRARPLQVARGTAPDARGRDAPARAPRPRGGGAAPPPLVTRTAPAGRTSRAATAPASGCCSPSACGRPAPWPCSWPWGSGRARRRRPRAPASSRSCSGAPSSPVCSGRSSPGAGAGLGGALLTARGSRSASPRPSPSRLARPSASRCCSGCPACCCWQPRPRRAHRGSPPSSRRRWSQASPGTASRRVASTITTTGPRTPRRRSRSRTPRSSRGSGPARSRRAPRS